MTFKALDFALFCIGCVAERLHLNLKKQALNYADKFILRNFYHSTTFQLINKGVADLHCNSDAYLVDEFCMEWEG